MISFEWSRVLPTVVGILESWFLDMFKALFLTIIIELTITILIKKYFDKPSLSKLFYLIWIWVTLFFIGMYLISSLLNITHEIMVVNGDMERYDYNDFIAIISVVIESILILLLPIYFYFKKNYLLLTVILINIITNPLLNFIIAFLWNQSLLIVIPLELIVIYVEYILLNYALWSENDKSDLYVPFYKQRNFKLSLIMNLCSWMIWYLIYL